MIIKDYKSLLPLPVVVFVVESEVLCEELEMEKYGLLGLEHGMMVEVKEFSMEQQMH